MAAPGIGDIAPDFTLEGPDGPFRLSEQRGSIVVLAFYPGDDTKVCTKQLCDYSAHRDELAGTDGAVVIGISAKDVDSKRRFAAKHDLTIPLLADPDRRVAALYGAKAPILGTKRSTFVIDAAGVIRYRHDATLGLSYVSVDELQAAIRAAQAPTAA